MQLKNIRLLHHLPPPKREKPLGTEIHFLRWKEIALAKLFTHISIAYEIT